jgi:tRNA threonylcarbamoyladenosine biosynthesis protein TsaB
MRILAIETVDKTGSVAALVDGLVQAELELDPTRRSAQTLVPGIAALLNQAGWKPHDVELVAVTTGPGSFTGLRIGVTTAKTFAYATGCQVLGVHSMLAIGWRVPNDAEHFSVVIDAQRNELFAADLSRVDGKLVGEESTRIVLGEPWANDLAEGATVTGPGLVKWADQLRPDVRIVEPALWRPTATSVGEAAWRQYCAGRRDDVLRLRPQYFRRTAAEEQWDRKQSGGAGRG